MKKMANEKRLIDAKQLKTDMYLLATMGDNENIFIDVIIDEIDNADEVDAVEVVHGEWEITEDDYYDLVEMKCSVCGESYGFEDYEDDIPKNYHYCPNCGAKMDGDGNG